MAPRRPEIYGEGFLNQQTCPPILSQRPPIHSKSTIYISICILISYLFIHIQYTNIDFNFILFSYRHITFPVCIHQYLGLYLLCLSSTYRTRFFLQPTVMILCTKKPHPTVSTALRMLNMHSLSPMHRWIPVVFGWILC